MYNFLLGQSRWKWPIPWQRWHLMSDVWPVEAVDEGGFTTAAPCKTEALLRSVAWGAIVEGVNNVEGACEVKGVIEERASEGLAVLDGS
jgi:hypothetical protein